MSRLDGFSVLLVEDNVDLLEVTSILLEGEGARVLGAATAADALAAATASPPDVVVTDLTLPDRDGLDLVRALRALPGLTRVPAIVMSGDVAPANREIQAHLLKPVDHDDLVAAIVRARHVDGGSAQR